MTADEFATLVRSSGKVRATNVLLHAEGKKVRGHGLLEITPKQLALHLEVSPKTPMPKSWKNIWRAQDFWSLSGTIEGDLRFSCNRVSPGDRADYWKTEKTTKTTTVIHLSHLELKTA